MRRVQIRDLERAKEIIRAEIRRTDESKLQHRLHCVLLVCEGKRCREVAELFGDSPRAVQYWVKRFDRSGVNGLRDAPKPGRPARLSATEKARLAQELLRSPREFGYSQNLWDGKLLSHHIHKNYGISLKVRQCQNLFHELGFRLRKPRPVIAKADPEKQEAFKKTPRPECR